MSRDSNNGGSTPADRDLRALERLRAARHPCIFIPTSEERHAIELVNLAALGSRDRVMIWSATRGLAEGLLEQQPSIPETTNAAGALHWLTTRLEHRAICIMLDLLDHLHDSVVKRALRDAISAFRRTESCLVLIDHQREAPGAIASCITRLELSLPDERELEQIVRRTIQEQHRRKPLETKLRRRELDAIIRNLRGLTRTQAAQIIVDCVAEDCRFDADDVEIVLAHKRRHLQHDGVLEFVEAPTDMNQIGGLDTLKKWLGDREHSFSERAIAFGLKPPRGVLLLGVQGAGKSLSAKAIATAWKRPLMRLDPGRLYDRYVGESERRLREALHQAEMMAPLVLWVDEIEKGFASAAARSTDGGLSQRMFGTLLTWMQEHDAPVFLVATANNIEALPPELLRKGRFDEIFFVDLPTTTVRKMIASIHLIKRGRRAEAFDLDAIAAAGEGFSGAEIEQAIIAAMHSAFAAGDEISTQYVCDAMRASPPLAVTMRERMAELREWAVDRCVPAG